MNIALAALIIFPAELMRSHKSGKIYATWITCAGLWSGSRLCGLVGLVVIRR
jgi:hypothetical protein